ncbi:hypothetical protein Tco_0865606 [Tanacetum coccineum]
MTPTQQEHKLDITNARNPRPSEEDKKLVVHAYYLDFELVSWEIVSSRLEAAKVLVAEREKEMEEIYAIDGLDTIELGDGDMIVSLLRSAKNLVLKNRRTNYISTFLNKLVSWEIVSSRLEAAKVLVAEREKEIEEIYAIDGLDTIEPEDGDMKVHKTGDISVLPDVPAGAVVQGLALGGGLEVPMGCNAWQLRKLNLACLNHILISCQALDV